MTIETRISANARSFFAVGCWLQPMVHLFIITVIFIVLKFMTRKCPATASCIIMCMKYQ